MVGVERGVRRGGGGWIGFHVNKMGTKNGYFS